MLADVIDIILDEAAQMLEPEALIAFTMANNKSTSIVMCGDDQQLGPVLFSPSGKHAKKRIKLTECSCCCKKKSFFACLPEGSMTSKF